MVELNDTSREKVSLPALRYVNRLSDFPVRRRPLHE